MRTRAVEPYTRLVEQLFTRRRKRRASRPKRSTSTTPYGWLYRDYDVRRVRVDDLRASDAAPSAQVGDASMALGSY
jgi:hypothetical protein